MLLQRRQCIAVVCSPGQLWQQRRPRYARLAPAMPRRPLAAPPRPARAQYPALYARGPVHVQALEPAPDGCRARKAVQVVRRGRQVPGRGVPTTRPASAAVIAVQRHGHRLRPQSCNAEQSCQDAECTDHLHGRRGRCTTVVETCATTALRGHRGVRRQPGANRARASPDSRRMPWRSGEGDEVRCGGVAAP
jgi:hypothetical protein